MGGCLGTESRSSTIEGTAARSVSTQRIPVTSVSSHVSVDHPVSINSSSQSPVNPAENSVTSSYHQQSSSNGTEYVIYASKYWGDYQPPRSRTNPAASTVVSSYHQSSSLNDMEPVIRASNYWEHNAPGLSFNDLFDYPDSREEPFRSRTNLAASTAVSGYRQQSSLTDMEIVIRASKYLEHTLKQNFEATGDGLGQYLRSATNSGGSLPSVIQRTISNIVSKRNLIVHQPECNTLTEKSRFVADFKNAWHSLKRLSSCSDHCSVCKDADKFLSKI